MKTKWFLIFALLVTPLLAEEKTNSIAKAPLYETRAEHDPNGTGVFFMGREIADVWEGGDWLERPTREEEEKTDLLVESLKLKNGEVVADIGAGTGYVTRRLAKKVGERGIVYAEEIQQDMLDTLTNKLAQI